MLYSVVDLRKWLFVIGAIVLLLGLVATVLSDISSTTYESELEVGRVSGGQSFPWNPMNLTGFFNEEDRISVSVLPRASWMFGPLEPDTEPIPVPHVGVLLRVFDPQGKNTTITIPFVRMESSMAMLMDFIWVMRHDGIAWENGKSYGTIKLTGNYSVEIFGVYPAGTEPPVMLIVYKSTPTVEHPYNFIFPIGVSALVVGLMFSVWSLSAKSKERVHRRTRKKRTRRKDDS